MVMNISLSPDLEEFVRRKIAAGPYSTVDDVVQQALRLLEEREDGGRPAPDKQSVRVAIKALEPELRRRGVTSAALFDVLVAIDPAARFDLIDLIGVQNLLGDCLGCPVDVVKKESLDPRIRGR